MVDIQDLVVNDNLTLTFKRVQLDQSGNIEDNDIYQYLTDRYGDYKWLIGTYGMILGSLAKILPMDYKVGRHISFLQRDDYFLFVICIDDRIIGTCDIKYVRDDEYHLPDSVKSQDLYKTAVTLAKYDDENKKDVCVKIYQHIEEHVSDELNGDGTLIESIGRDIIEHRFVQGMEYRFISSLRREPVGISWVPKTPRYLFIKLNDEKDYPTDTMSYSTYDRHQMIRSNALHSCIITPIGHIMSVFV